MPSLEPLVYLANGKLTLTKQEKLIIEAALFSCICNELKAILKKHNQNYFHLIKLSYEMEERMLENNFIKFIIMDILQTGEYDITGISYYSQVPEEVIVDVLTGNNLSPSAFFLRKMIELHKTVRKELYLTIIKKFSNEFIHNEA